MIPRVSFVVVDGHLIDLDWILPVIGEFRAQGWHTHLLVVPQPDPAKHGLALHLAAQVACELEIGLAGYEPLPGAGWLARRARGGGWGGRLAGLYASDRHLTFTRRSWLPWRRDRLRDALARRFARADLVFVSHRKDAGDGTPSGVVQAAARHAGTPVVAYPPTADFHVAFTTIEPADLVLVNTKGQRQRVAAMTSAPVVAVGSPKFAPAWRGRVTAAYEAVNGRVALPPGRQPVLLVLKNESSPIWDGISWADTTLAAIDQLRGPNRFLILKPHPRQDLASLSRLLAAVPAQDYLVDMGPLSYWSERAEVVLSLFSGGALDPLAAGKVPYVYWPITDAYRRHLDSGTALPTMTALYLDGVDGSYKTHYDDFAITISTPHIDLAARSAQPYLDRFQATFAPGAAAQRVVEACRDLLAGRLHGGPS